MSERTLKQKLHDFAYEHWFKIVAIVFMLLASLAIYLQQEKIIRQSMEYSQLTQTLKDTVGYFEIRETNSGALVAEQKQKILTMNNALAAGLIREEELKDKNIKLLQSQVTAQEEIAILNDSIEWLRKPDVIVTPDEIVSATDSTEADTIKGKTYMEVPMEFTKMEPKGWYEIHGSIDTMGLVIDSMKVRSEPKVTFAMQHDKSKFLRIFKRAEPVVMWENANPYASTQGLQNLVIEPDPPKWYERKGFWFGSGVVVTSAIFAVIVATVP